MDSIIISNLKKEYSDIIAVNNLNLSIKNGELFGLLGVNGAGKTTTIKMLSGLTKPSDGDAIILGKSILTNMQDIKEDIALSPQETAIAPNLTVKENVELFAEIYNISGNDLKVRITEILNTFSLTDIQKKKAKTLSGGWQRKLSIAMALISNPKILFLDEPTLGLDVLARRDLWNTINRLKGNVTIILTTHYLEEAEALCDRIAIMNVGEIKDVGTPKELINKTNSVNIEEAFIKIVGKGGVLI